MDDIGNHNQTLQILYIVIYRYLYTLMMSGDFFLSQPWVRQKAQASQCLGWEELAAAGCGWCSPRRPKNDSLGDHWRLRGMSGWAW